MPPAVVCFTARARRELQEVHCPFKRHISATINQSYSMVLLLTVLHIEALHTALKPFCCYTYEKQAQNSYFLL